VVGDPAARRRSESAQALYDRAVAQARQAGFYTELGVPDTHDGRLELLRLHLILLLRRLQRGGPDGQALGQVLFDTFLRDLDRSLREGGVGDLSVGKWVKTIAQQFYARATALEPALAQEDDAAVARVVAANVYGVEEPHDAARALARYLLAADSALAAQREHGTALDALRLSDIAPIRGGRPATA